MNYLQVILQVRPEKIGDTYKYSLEWNGQTNKGVPATPGNYTANLIIPARPNQYSSTIQFHWK
jgi:flagellar hook assembly protein FlgD